MKVIVFICSMMFAVPALASQDLEKCAGRFVISSPSNQTMVDEFLAGSAKFLSATQVSAKPTKVFQVRALNADTISSTTSIMAILANLEGVIVECDHEVGR